MGKALFTSQDELTARVLRLLSSKPNQWYTARELIEQEHIFGSPTEIQKRLTLLTRDGLARTKSSYGELYYQIIMSRKKPIS